MRLVLPTEPPIGPVNIAPTLSRSIPCVVAGEADLGDRVVVVGRRQASGQVLERDDMSDVDLGNVDC